MENRNRPRLLLLKGLPGSGKTTYAKKLEKQGWARANKDDIRKMFFSNYTHKDEAEVVRMEDARVVAALLDGKNVVVDDTNFAPKHRRRLEAMAQKHGAEFKVMFIDTPLEECIK